MIDYPRYLQHLKSDYWAAVKQRIGERANGICERCKKQPIEHNHHLTYQHIYNELDHLESVAGWCGDCHRAEHDIPKLLNRYSSEELENICVQYEPPND